jgi:hypothetical protein
MPRPICWSLVIVNIRIFYVIYAIFYPLHWTLYLIPGTRAMSAQKARPATSESRDRVMSNENWHPRNDDLLRTARKLRQLADDLTSTMEQDYLQSLNPNVSLNSWRIATRAIPCMNGCVTNHPILNSGPIFTSQLYFIDPEMGLARTYSRWYRLLGKHSSSARFYS